MKRFIYLLNAIFLLLFTKSFIFANDLESKINYLLELSKNNISQANSLMSLLRLLTVLFTLAFVTVIGFVIVKLIELANQIKANKKVLKTIKEHGDILATFGDRLTTLAGETTKNRDQIRDQNLMAGGITDKHYGNLLEKVLKIETTPPNMNMIRNLVWTLFKPEEYESGLERLGKIFGDPGIPPLMKKIRRDYFEIFEETIPQIKLLTWVYEIKENNKEIEELIKEELEAKIRIEEGRRKLLENIPPLYPERKPSKLWQILGDLPKKTKSDE